MDDNDYLKLEWHAKMMVVAREHWPEMPESPSIVGAFPGIHTVLVPVLSSDCKVETLGENDFLFVHVRDEWISTRQPVLFGQERIELEQVGPYQLGYGPITQTLYVGSEGG